MLYNPNTERFVTSFRGTLGDIQLVIESLDSIIPVTYTLHNIKGAKIDGYFNDRYIDHMRPVLIPKL